MSTYSIITFGCRVNQGDSLEVERDLRARGMRAVDAAEAEVILVNTCSVTASADQGARQTIRRLHRQNPRARLVVTGCYASVRAAAVAQLPGVERIVSNEDKADLGAIVAALAGPPPAERFGDDDGPCGAVIEPGIAGRTAWTLRAQTGCEQPCAYCIIPLTRGRPRSRPLPAVIHEVQWAADSGFKEIAVTGVHLGAWGRDLSPALGLADLLRALADHPADVVFRISSLEPMDCTPEVRQLMTGSRRFAPHFHLPLQHGSDRVLRAMRRPYTLEYYSGLVDFVRAALPHASIGSDVLVGFPGEREDDHARNVAWLDASPLTHLHVFPYSDRPGTAASGLPGKVHGATVRARADEIRRVGTGLTARFRRSMDGTTRPGLTLDDGTLVVTDNYLKVRIDPGLPRNARVRVRIDAAQDPMTGSIVGRG